MNEKKFSSINIINKKKILHGGYRLKKKYSPPLFSLITAVYNGDKFIDQTITSILKQNKQLYEHIIIDGGSNDKTLNIIKKYNKKIAYWISEKDKGLYDAFNKGMKLAKGKYIIIINSDDRFTTNALKLIKKYTEKYPDKDFIFGSVRKHWGIVHGFKPEKIKYSWGFYSSHSTGFIIKRSSAIKVGLYNIKYKYHADYDYFYRMIVKKNLTGIATKEKEIVGIFRRGGFSSKIPYRKLFIEELKIRINNNQNIFLVMLIACYKIYKHFKKIIK